MFNVNYIMAIVDDNNVIADIQDLIGTDTNSVFNKIGSNKNDRFGHQFFKE